MVKPTNIEEMAFSLEEVDARYNEFIRKFLSGEANVERTEVFPRFWTINVQGKDFSATIKLESRLSGYGFEEWMAIVEEPNGEKSNFLLFEEELEAWLAKQRKLRGLE